MTSQRALRAPVQATLAPRLSANDAATLAECREILEQNSKSFALAGKLLPRAALDRAAALYAYCRRVDDAVDGAPPEDQERALAGLQRDLEGIYRGESRDSADLRAFRALAASCAIPRSYPSELIEGMAMDVRNTRYETLEELLLYCHRVAGVVGLMMCHVFGVTRDRALVQAAHLGIAMQLTNICRDVAEDFAMGRVYLPRELLREAGAPELPHPAQGPLPSDPQTREAMKRVMQRLLAEAERYYRSADGGIDALPFRAGLAVRAARRLYHAIGVEVQKRGYDPGRGRAVVSRNRKLWLVLQTLAEHVMQLPRSWLARLRDGQRPRLPRTELRFPEDVIKS